MGPPNRILASSLPLPPSEDAAGEAVLPTTEAGPLEACRSSRSSRRPATVAELDNVATQLVGVVGAWSWRGGGGCSGVGVVNPDGRGWCVASKNDLGLSEPQLRCVAAARETTCPALRPWWSCRSAWGHPPSTCWMVVMPVVVNGPLIRWCPSLFCGGRSSQRLHPRPRSPAIGRLRQYRGLGSWPGRWLDRVKALHVDACGRPFLPRGMFVASIVPPPLECQGKP
jgi:hypothetical protein